jgi:hypothetical protein
MGKVSSSTLTMPDMKVTGSTIHSTVMERSSGTMGPPDTKDNSSRERRMVRAGSIGRTAATMRDSSSMETLKAMAPTISLTLTRPILESSEKVIWKAVVLRFGLMDGATREISRMGKRTAKVLSNGLTVTNILEVGGMENSMESVCGSVSIKGQERLLNGKGSG